MILTSSVSTMMAPKYSDNFLTGSISPLVTFARLLGTATRTNSAGVIEVVAANTPRFDFDPVTNACLGLLIEESRTNLMVQSGNLTEAGWQRLNSTSVTTTAVTTLDGGTNAALLTASVGTGSHRLLRSHNVPAKPATMSLFVKAGTARWIQLANDGDAASYANFDVVGGVVGSIGSGCTARIKLIKDGWYRCEVTFGATLAINSVATIYMMNSDINSRRPSWTAVGTETLYLWGCQVEAGGFASSYIPTTTVLLVRNADVATITGTKFSSIWNSLRGTVLAKVRPMIVSAVSPWVQFDNNTSNNIISIRGNITDPELYIKSTTDQVQIDVGTIASGISFTVSGAWAENNCAANANGGTPIVDVTATIPAATQARLGSDGTNYLNGYIEQIEYYNERVLDASLQVVSSPAGYRSIISPVILDAIIS